MARINAPAGSGLQLRSPANLEETASRVYAVNREIQTNPVTGAANVTQTFISSYPKLSTTVTGSRSTPVKGEAFTGEVASITDPGAGPSGYTATINWGDGTPTSVGTVTPNGNRLLSISGNHTYLTEGTVAVTTTVVANDAFGLSTKVGTGLATVILPAATPPPPFALAPNPPQTPGVPVTPTPVATTPVSTTPTPAAVKLFKLTVTVTGSGTVSRSPSGSSYKSIRSSGGAIITVSYASGTDVKLTAKPGAKSTFGKWTGCKKVTGAVCQTGKLSSAKQLKLSFKKK